MTKSAVLWTVDFILELLTVILTQQADKQNEQKIRSFRYWYLFYRRRKTIGQLIIIPTEPYGAPPGPVIHPSWTSPSIWNSSVTRDLYPLSIASGVHSPKFASHNGL